MNHPLLDVLVREIETDISQMAEQGHDEGALLAELAEARGGGSLDALAELQQDLWERPSPADFPYDEPSDWEAISDGFPDADSHAIFAGGDADLAEKLLAGWRGRCAGCQLGKPLEGAWPDAIEEVLAITGPWPLTDYMNPVPDDRVEALGAGCEAFKRHYRKVLTKGNFDHVAPDDDIHYAITGQLTLARHGPNFTPTQAIETLIELTPASSVYASGRNMFRTHFFGLPSPVTAIFGNPCRQSLGAQIRCDPFGWAAPANPAFAASMAFRDAVGSQIRNGIYSGIFFAVLLADVLAHGDLAAAIDTAEAYVPPRSRFAEMVRFVKDACAGAKDWQAVNAAIYGKYDAAYGKPSVKAPTNHSLSNAAIVVMSLLTGGDDFGRTVGISVMAGRDTDCNGATAGSIMGCALGTAGIGARWTDPFNDTIRTHLKGMHEVRISQLAEDLFELAKGNLRR
ncbi:hypothetical protein LCGC14_2357400 [marine sediment metagenome]|uniref:ADP-ribosylglycohydrolase n=1 Tax=marine sediment metagenome TaxID=412755 RepID=A0A0F9EK68_9ZZZZ